MGREVGLLTALLLLLLLLLLLVFLLLKSAEAAANVCRTSAGVKDSAVTITAVAETTVTSSSSTAVLQELTTDGSMIPLMAPFVEPLAVSVGDGIHS